MRTRTVCRPPSSIRSGHCRMSSPAAVSWSISSSFSWPWRRRWESTFASEQAIRSDTSSQLISNEAKNTARPSRSIRSAIAIRQRGYIANGGAGGDEHQVAGLKSAELLVEVDKSGRQAVRGPLALLAPIDEVKQPGDCFGGVHLLALDCRFRGSGISRGSAPSTASAAGPVGDHASRSMLEARRRRARRTAASLTAEA